MPERPAGRPVKRYQGSFRNTRASERTPPGATVVESGIARYLAGTLAVAAVLMCVGSTYASSGVSRGPTESSATVAPFTLLPPHGITLWMHPTAARIVLTVTSNGRLRACEVGTTFSYYWRGGCRAFTAGHLKLPSSGGAVHIGFRLVPIAGRPIQVARLHVQWHCVDHFFLLQRGDTKARLRAPVVLDC